MTEKKTQKDVQEEIRKNLESLLDDMPDSGRAIAKSEPDGISEGIGDKLEHPFAQAMNFHEVQVQAEVDAKKVLKSLIDFYLGAKIIKKNDYAKYKNKVDEMSLSNMMFAIKISQHAVKKLMEDIDMGNTHPRNFEALVALNGQMMNMIKHQQALFVTMEEGYKKIRNDHDEQENRVEDAEAEVDDIGFGQGSYKARGTKLLMQNLKKKMSEKEDETEGDDEMSEQPRLTNARKRPNNPMGDTKKNDVDKDDEIYGDLDEHF